MSRERGFSLVEVTIVIAILAMAAAIVLPALSNVSRAELKKAAGQLGGTIRATYDRAALTGEQHRLAIDIEKSVIHIEVHPPTDSKAQVVGLAGLLAGSAHDEDAPTEQVQPPPELMRLFGGGTGDDEDDEANVGDGFTTAAKDLTFDDDVHIMDVSVAGMGKPVSEGTVYLNFFPSGYTDNAAIHLADPDSHVFTVKVLALSGKVEIVAGYAEADK